MKSKFLKLAGLAMAALFCTIEVNAQVGIGTPTPKTSAQLEIVAGDKGILIPRVTLTDTLEFAPITGDADESLLVYNLNKKGTAGNVNVDQGFYYWIPATVANSGDAHWERIVNQAQLDEVINNMNLDVDKIKALLNIAFPSNNINDAPQNDGPAAGGGLVYTPAGADPATDPATIDYVYWDDTDKVYKKEDALSSLKDLLGDTFNNTTVNYTGDTWIDGNKIYSTVLEGFVKGGTAIFVDAATKNLGTLGGVYYSDEGKAFAPTGIQTVQSIIKLTLVDDANTLINQTVTDVQFASGKLSFRVGTGKQYSVLDATDKAIKVIVEFSGTPTP